METIWGVIDGDQVYTITGDDEQAARRIYIDYIYDVRRGVRKAPIKLICDNRLVEEDPDPNDVWAARQPCSKMALQRAAQIIAATARDGTTSVSHTTACFETLQHFPEEHQLWNNDVRSVLAQKSTYGTLKGEKWLIAQMTIAAMLDGVEASNEGYVLGRIEGALSMLRRLSGHATQDIDNAIGLSTLVRYFKDRRIENPAFELEQGMVDSVVSLFLTMPMPE